MKHRVQKIDVTHFFPCKSVLINKKKMYTNNENLELYQKKYKTSLWRMVDSSTMT